MAYQCFGDGAVHAVHRHMIAVIGGPAQRQFGQIAGAHHQTIGLIGDIHQHLCPFSGLSVFKGDAVIVKIVADIGKMGFYCITDVYGAEGNAQFLTKKLCIGAGAVGSAETRHGNSHNISAGSFQQIHGFYCHQQSQGGIQTAADADNRCF